jgi:hypothetical protein
MRKLAFTCLLLVAVQAAHSHPTTDGAEVPPPAAEETVGLERVYRAMQECAESNMATCLKKKALQYVDRALRKSDSIDVFDGISLVKSESVESSRGLNGRSLSESELDESMVKDEDEKDTQVENLLLDRVARFLESHTLQLKVPESSISSMRRSLDEGKYRTPLPAHVFGKPVTGADTRSRQIIRRRFSFTVRSHIDSGWFPAIKLYA